MKRFQIEFAHRMDHLGPETDPNTLVHALSRASAFFMLCLCCVYAVFMLFCAVSMVCLCCVCDVVVNTCTHIDTCTHFDMHSSF